jgi:PAS domain S-box-containing protein
VSNTIMRTTLPEPSLRARLIFLGLGLGLLALVVNTAISYRNLEVVAENNRLETHTQAVLGEIEKVLSILKDAETGQRGYLLTGQDQYLEPYKAAINRVTPGLQTLKELTSEDPQQQERLVRLESKVRVKLSELESTIRIYEERSLATAVETVKTDRGKKAMDDIRAVGEEMKQDEQDRLERRSARSDRSLQQSRLILLLGSAAVLALLLATAVGVLEHFKYRQKTAERIRGERKWLEVTLASIGDAVLATDNQGRISFLNKTAESLTGWTEALARGKPLDEVFRIINEQTRNKVENPVTKVLREGVVVGLANHTVLIARNGTERPIDDSAAPIFDESGDVYGVVLVFRDATSQREAQEALQKLAAIVQFSDDAMISKTIDGTITSWNAGAERLFGFTAGEAIGQPIDLIVPGDRREEEAGIMRRLTAGERVDHFDTVRRRKDGSRFDASLSISPIKNSYGEIVGASKVLRDITERKRSEGALALLARASRALAVLTDRGSALQQTAMMTVPFFADWCVVYCINQDGNIEPQAYAHRDPEKQRLLSEILKKYPLDWNSPAISVRVLRSGKTEFVEDMPESLVMSVVRSEEEREAIKGLNPRSIISVPLLIRDRVVGVISFAASESSRRYKQSDVDFAEDLAGRVATAIDNAHLFDSVKQADRQKDEFLAMLAHELRNPLAAIQYASVLVQMPSSEPKTELFEIIERQIKNLARLIDDLLDISRISQNKIQLKREYLDAATVVARAAAAARPLMEQKKHTFTIDVAKDAMPLYADATRAEQIIANLLTNAAKYTPDGGQIALRAYPQEGMAVIKVKDTGVGLPPQMLPRVFELFAQVDRTLDRSEGGLGIGLTIVRKLAEMHGGSVSVASDGLGRGSEFTVRLPLSDGPSSPLMGDHQPAVQNRLKILVVDDNLDTARSAALWLTAAGHDVREANDGHSALEIARDFRPHAMLLDIGLPGMNGYDLARALRSDGFGKETLIAISGYGQADDRRRSQEAGFNHHLVKPVDHQVLVSLLQSITPDDLKTESDA